MAIETDDPDRDAVIDAFTRDCPNPDAAQVKEWTKRHPEHARDIVIHAAVLIAQHVSAVSQSRAQAKPRMMPRSHPGYDVD